jgi:hypothetical protein
MPIHVDSWLSGARITDKTSSSNFRKHWYPFVIRSRRGPANVGRRRVVKRNRVDGELRSLDKELWRKALVQKREHSIAHQWHGKICRRRSSGEAVRFDNVTM